MKVMSGAQAEVRVGNCLPLENIPVGTQIHNIELLSWKGRTACSFSRKLALSLWLKKANMQHFVFLQAR